MKCQNSPEQFEQFVVDDKFGERLKQIRKKQGMVQKDFGESLGVSLATITRLERGLFKPQVDFLEKLAKKYNCEIHLILTGQEKRGAVEGETESQQVIRHPRIYNLLKAQRTEWVEIVENALRATEGSSDEERKKAEDSVKTYRDGIDYLDALLAIGIEEK